MVRPQLSLAAYQCTVPVHREPPRIDRRDEAAGEVCANRHEVVKRVRRPGAGRKTAVTHQPDLPAALETRIEDAIRGDPCSPLRRVSRSQRHLVKALAEQGFRASQWEHKMQLPSQPHDARGVQSPRPRCTVSAVSMRR